MLKTTVTIIAAGLALATAAGSGAAAGRQPSPQRLYSALLTSAFPDSELPSGFFSAKVSIQEPGKSGRHYHVIGEVTVAVDGPDPDDGMDFVVFPNAADARGELNHPTFTGNSSKVHIVPGGVPGFPKMAGHMWTGSITGKNAFGKTITDGVTLVAVQQGNVVVDAVTDSADSTSSGNVPAALQLLHAALRHLAKVS